MRQEQPSDLLSWQRLALTPGVGPAIARHLLEHFESPDAIFEAPPEALRELLAPRPRGVEVARALKDPLHEREARQELERAARLGIQLLARSHPGFPSRLLTIYDPPLVLGVRGAVAPDEPHSVAIVGSRRATGRILDRAFKLARQLARAGVLVVSGLARGVDRAAHEGALAAPGGRTVAIQGCGLGRIYPTEHRGLASRIVAAGGAILSELPVDAAPLAHHFPLRNRLLSGLSSATVVVAADAKSGALITGNQALEQGRGLFAYPGAPEDPLARGTNRLIQDLSGQILCTGPDEVLEFLGLPRPEPADVLRDATPLPGLAGEIEVYLQEECSVRTFDEIVLGGGFEARAALAALGTLELKGRVRRVSGRGYEACA